MKMARVTIRRVDEDDPFIQSELLDLHQAVFAKPYSAPLPTNGEEWPGAWWIGYDGDLPVSFAGAEPGHGLGLSTAAYLTRVGVLLTHRGHGLQRRHMQAIERWARQEGYRSIVSDTTKNPPSANNFIACGYKTFTPKEPWSFDAAIYWTKLL